MLNGLDLFSGIGGITIALSPWVRPIAYCENDRYAQSVLLSRMGNRDLPEAPIWDDIRTLSKDVIGDEPVDIIYGGFPCQDISSCGTKKGLAGKRSGLFFEIMRLISELRPQFVFLENVPDVSTRGLDRICMEFAALGFDCRWTIVSAAEVGATQIRSRWFFLANSKSVRRKKGRLQFGAKTKNPIFDMPNEYDGWDLWTDPKPLLGGKVHGIPARVDRIKCLGNAVVPLQAKEAFKRLMGIDF